MYNLRNPGVERTVYSELYAENPDPDVVLAEQLGQLTWGEHYQEAVVVAPRIVKLPASILVAGER
jgi:hypothetical protein